MKGLETRCLRPDDRETLLNIVKQISDRSDARLLCAKFIDYYTLAGRRGNSHVNCARVVIDRRGRIVGFFSGSLVDTAEVAQNIETVDDLHDPEKVRPLKESELVEVNRGERSAALFMTHCFWLPARLGVLPFVKIALTSLESWFRGNQIDEFHCTVVGRWRKEMDDEFTFFGAKLVDHEIEPGFHHVTVKEPPHAWIHFGHEILKDRRQRLVQLAKVYPSLPNSDRLLEARVILTQHPRLEKSIVLATGKELLDWEDRDLDEPSDLKAKSLQDRFKELETFRNTFRSALTPPEGVDWKSEVGRVLANRTSKGKPKDLLTAIVDDLREWPELMCLR